MSFWKGLAGLFGGGFFGGDNKNKKEDPITTLQRQIQPLIDQSKETNTKLTTAGLGDTGVARDNYNFVIDYFKKVMDGSPDDLMKLFDAQGLTRGIDENIQQLSESGVRGGARAASLGNAGFDRNAVLNQFIQQIRNAAPGQIAQIAQSIGNLGLGELSAAQGASAQASNNIFGITNAQFTQKQLHDQQITSIISAIAGAAGAAAGGL